VARAAGRLDTRDLLADAVTSGVLFAPGSQFYSDGRPSNAMRLAFAMADEAALRRGVERLARVVAAHRANGAPPTGRVPV
jgi:DNA-binding transcriptional MocR family regulator